MFIMSRGLFENLTRALALERQWTPGEPVEDLVKRRLHDPVKPGDVDWRNEAGRPPEYALRRQPPEQYPVERRPGWLVEEDRWTGEWVYTREADGAEVRVMYGGTWDDAEFDLDEFERTHPIGVRP